MAITNQDGRTQENTAVSTLEYTTISKKTTLLRIFAEVEFVTGVEHKAAYIEGTIRMLLKKNDFTVGRLEAVGEYILRITCRYVRRDRLVMYGDFFPTDAEIYKAGIKPNERVVKVAL